MLNAIAWQAELPMKVTGRPSTRGGISTSMGGPEDQNSMTPSQ